ncbi:MAG: hypothetical protein R3F37_13740 [Candidatus Competibacteraceae bacterium]
MLDNRSRTGHFRELSVTQSNKQQLEEALSNTHSRTEQLEEELSNSQLASQHLKGELSTHRSEIDRLRNELGIIKSSMIWRAASGCVRALPGRLIGNKISAFFQALVVGFNVTASCRARILAQTAQ